MTYNIIMSMLILRHSADNSLGDLEPLLGDFGLEYTYWDTSSMHPDAIHLPAKTTGLIILGGMMNADQEAQYAFLSPEKQLIRYAVLDAEIPVFGICLGAQMLARSLGAKVTKNPVKEVGWRDIRLTEAGKADPVLSQLGDNTPQFQWHEDTFALPEGSTLLAETDDCPRQAYRVKDNVYGVQFHPEVNIATIQQWLAESRSLPEATGRAIWEETREYYDQRLEHSQAMFSAFLTQAYRTAIPFGGAHGK